MQTLNCFCNSVHFPGLTHAKDRQIFLLVSYVKSLQNIAQTSAKTWMQTLIFLCNMVHFRGIIHAKDRKMFLLIFKLESWQNTAQTSAKDLHANIKFHLQFGPFCRHNSCKRQVNLSAYFQTKILAKHSATFCQGPACKHWFAFAIWSILQV